mmetsp:Transcript_21884/g.32262  ORF Transcript_21884/g.32262 Transcript_21884/m.32262 type:complete len:97 (+) Transcript_21884:702-992(+)
MSRNVAVAAMLVDAGTLCLMSPKTKDLSCLVRYEIDFWEGEVFSFDLRLALKIDPELDIEEEEIFVLSAVFSIYLKNIGRVIIQVPPSIDTSLIYL